MRRFIRLTEAFSKKLDNHSHVLSLYWFWVHFALKTTLFSLKFEGCRVGETCEKGIR